MTQTWLKLCLVASTKQPYNGHGRARGRPRLGDVRLETIVPKAVWEELLRREAATGVYRTRVAANILTEELVGCVRRPLDSSHT